MHKRTTARVFRHARELHRNMTPAEARLWTRLRVHRLEGIHFKNHTCPGGQCQGHAIGHDVVDFCAPRRKLIIELVGGQHFEQEEYDSERIEYLESKGYKVLRFWNNDVMKDIEGVIRAIIQTMEAKHPPHAES